MTLINIIRFFSEDYLNKRAFPYDNVCFIAKSFSKKPKSGKKSPKVDFCGTKIVRGEFSPLFGVFEKLLAIKQNLP